MKTYEQCLQELNESNELVKRLVEMDKENRESIRENLVGKSRFNKSVEVDELIAEYKRKKEELKEQILVRRIEHKIKLHNAKYAMWAECVPIIIEVYGKYVGKQYGLKTREKIEQEFKTATDDRFTCYVAHGSVHVYSNDRPYDVKIEIPVRYDLFAGNTIEKFTEEDLKFPGYRKEFIEDTRKAALELIEQHRKVQATMEALRSEASKYKAMSVGGMKELPYYQPLSDVDIY